MLSTYGQQYTQSVQQGFLDSLRQRERAKMDEYIAAREYYDGVHDTQLTDRARQYLNVRNADAEFTVNYCPMVVNAKADRLQVTGFETEDAQSDVLFNWWRKNRLDRKQGIIHRTAVRDGDSFILVEWDNDAGIPRFHYEPAYTGDGVMVYYSEERRDEIAFASKAWRITHGSGAGKSRRLNLYFPDRIERYMSHDDINAGFYMPYLDEDDDTIFEMQGHLGMAGVSWWTDNGNESGNPLGVPIIHFKHNDIGDQFGTSHLANVMPIQDAVNKAMIDLLAAIDTEGFGLLVGYGTQKWADIKVGPGAIAAVYEKPTDAKLERISPSNSGGLLSTYNALVMEIGRVSGTPLSYFQVSGSVAAEGTMKQQEVALISQVEKSQVDFGNAWEDCMIMARRLHNAFSKEPELDEDVIIDTIWTEAETRNDKEQAETLAIKVEKLDVSTEQAQIEMGYNDTQIASFAREKRRKQAMAIRNMQGQAPPEQTQDEAQAQTMTQTENEDTDDIRRTPAA